VSEPFELDPPILCAECLATTYAPGFFRWTFTGGRWRCEEHSPLVLPGWTCSACRAVNGEAKATRDTCRACGAPK
jgi:hypothetical protein